MFKEFPLSFHKRAMPAADAAECAREQGKFWQMHDVLFANQRQLEDAQLESYAGSIGLDVARWKQCFAENRHKDRILADQREASALGVRGTPAFFINGRYLSGAQPLEAFKKIIDEELNKARKSGIPKAQYYAKVVEEQGEKHL